MMKPETEIMILTGIVFVGFIAVGFIIYAYRDNENTENEKKRNKLCVLKGYPTCNYKHLVWIYNDNQSLEYDMPQLEIPNSLPKGIEIKKYNPKDRAEFPGYKFLRITVENGKDKEEAFKEIIQEIEKKKYKEK